MNENTKAYDLGFKTGCKAKKQRNAVKNLVYIGTAPCRNFDLIRDKAVALCISVQEPIPEFFIDLNKDPGMELTAYLTGLLNGSLHENKESVTK